MFTSAGLDSISAVFGYIAITIIMSCNLLTRSNYCRGVFARPTAHTLDVLESAGRISAADRIYFMEISRDFEVTKDGGAVLAAAIARNPSAETLMRVYVAGLQAFAIMSERGAVDESQAALARFVENHRDSKAVRCLLSLSPSRMPASLTTPRDRLNYLLAIGSASEYLNLALVCHNQLGIRDPNMIADVISLLAVGDVCARNNDFPLCGCASDVFRMYAVIACGIKLRPSTRMTLRAADFPDSFELPRYIHPLKCYFALEAMCPEAVHLRTHVTAQFRQYTMERIQRLVAERAAKRVRVE